MFGKEEDCYLNLASLGSLVWNSTHSSGCNGTYDEIMCWESVPANTTIKKQCPNLPGVFDSTKYVYKTCTQNGVWDGFNKTFKTSGWTDYDTCMTESALRHSKIPNYELILKIVLLEELIGISASFICLSFSLFIFFSHKNLINNRTRIHLNLFFAILLQSIIRLIFFVDELVYKMNLKDGNDEAAYQSQMMKIHISFCPLFTSLLEYFQNCNFMWMLNEGIYLNVLLTYPIFDSYKQRFIYGAFLVIGWLLPALIVLVWFLTMYFINGFNNVCWYGYYEVPYYWIIQTPILISLIVNTFCLTNVIRVLTNKLREHRTSETIQIKKGVKAAILLLPLLGITHITKIYQQAPIFNWTLLLIYECVNCFLVHYQGVFLSILYCFMNNEVRNELKRHWLAKLKLKNRLFDTKSNKTKLADRTNEDQERKLINTEIPLSDLSMSPMSKSVSESTIVI